jgi:hypothetical protein
MKETIIAIKAQAAALIIQFGLNMAHKVCDEAFEHDPEAGEEIKTLLDKAHGLLLLVARHADRSTPKPTPVLKSVGGDKKTN